MIATDFEFIRFEQVGDTGKTTVWRCVNKRYDTILGAIRWFGSWRQYVFLPAINTFFSSGCLKDIQEFINQLMQERKESK